MPQAEPIVLFPPSPIEHKLVFEEERLRVAIGLKRLPAAIEHIGSTAIAGIRTKPIIDMMVGMRALPLSAAIEPLAELGYAHMAESGSEARLVFRRKANHTFHLHAVLFDQEEWRRHIIFRDWLNLHSDLAKEYEALKTDLAEKFANDRQAYTDGKNAFVEKVLVAAAEYPALRLGR